MTAQRGGRRDSAIELITVETNGNKNRQPWFTNEVKQLAKGLLKEEEEDSTKP